MTVYTIYTTAHEAKMKSAYLGQTTGCVVNMQNYNDMVEDCNDRRLMPDGSIVFKGGNLEPWTVVMASRPWPTKSEGEP